MKMSKRAMILSLTFVFAFMFTAAFAEVAAAGRFFPLSDKRHVRMQGISIQAKHDWYNENDPILHISRHDLTLKKGQSYTLKATLVPGGKSVSVKWKSANSKIVKVSSSGKVTAVAPGTTMIWAETERYSDHLDETGYSNECWVTIQGGAKDAKPVGISDRSFSYGNFKFTAVTSKQEDALAKIKKNIGGYTFYGSEFGIGLLLGSNDNMKAHTGFFVADDYLFRFFARGKSLIKTNRGIMVGAKKSTIQQKYGVPSIIRKDYTTDMKSCEALIYRIKTPGKNLFMDLSFNFLKSKDTVYEIEFYLGEFGDY